jgi:hypothetical protein
MNRITFFAKSLLYLVLMIMIPLLLISACSSSRQADSREDQRNIEQQNAERERLESEKKAEERKKIELAAQRDVFQSRVNEYIRMARHSQLQEPYIHGKLIVVEQENDNYVGKYPLKVLNGSSLSSVLPPELIASTPGEVGTVVFVEFYTKVVGYYSDKTPAFEEPCDVTIIDTSIVAAITKRHFASLKPASSVRGGNQPDPRPWKEIYDFLKGLPRR